MSQNCRISKDSVNSVSWEKMRNTTEGFFMQSSSGAVSAAGRGAARLSCVLASLPSRVPVLGLCRRFKRGVDFGAGKKMGSELKRLPP